MPADGARVAPTRCSAIINDILDFSKIEAGRLELEARRLRPARLRCDDAAEAGRAAGPREGPGAGIATSRPACPDRTWSATRPRLRQVLVNLVGNAIKFTARAGEVTVTARAGEPGDGVPSRRCASPSRDTGIGIPADAAGIASSSRSRQADALDHAPVRRHGPGPADLASASST